MTVTPNTRVRLLANVPLSNNYEHQMMFNSQTEQNDYFTTKVTHWFDEYTYQRKDQSIKVNKGYDQLYNCNYLMYQNTDYTGQWFYAFITEKEYINENVTRIVFEIDVWQTWMFDVTFLPSFVEREHCDRWNSDGTPVINTVPENLEIGTEYDVVKNEVYSGDVANYYLITATTDLTEVLSDSNPPENPPLPSPKLVQGLLTGLSYYLFTDGTDSQGTYTPPPDSASPYPIPLPDGSYSVSDWFGTRGGTHMGIDFAAPTGTPVYGIEGEVVYAQFHRNSDGSPGFGNRVVIKSFGDNLYHGYAHLNSINVTVGEIIEVDPVNGFKTIGTVGSTGDSTGPHLHYTIATGGLWSGYVDPAPYLGLTAP